jgi:hypothetical protein
VRLEDYFLALYAEVLWRSIRIIGVAVVAAAVCVALMALFAGKERDR